MKPMPCYWGGRTKRSASSRRIHRPVALWARLTDIGTPFLRPAAQEPVHPPFGDGFSSMYRAQKRSADGGVGVGVTAPLDGIYDSFLEILGVEQLP